MIIRRKRYEVRDGDDTYVVDKEKGVTRYRDPVTGEYIESKITSGTVNIKPSKFFSKDRLIRNLVAHKSASNYK